MARTLTASQPDVELHVEYMNSKRVAPRRIFPLLRDLYATAYKDVHLDMILCSDDNALDFLLAHRDALFPGVPVVFCGVNRFRPARIAGHAGYTGVSEDIDVRGTLEAILHLHPRVREIAIITDVTATGRINRQLVQDVMPEFRSRVAFRDLAELAAEDLQKALASLGADTVVYNLSFLLDPKGRVFSPKESTAFVDAATDSPIYTAWDFYMGSGVVGGKLVSGTDQGQLAASLALRILGGERPDTIPVAPSPNRYLFDYPSLLRYGIDLGRLPEHSHLLHQPNTFYDRNKSLIWAATGVFLLQLGTILVLLGNIRRRRMAERAVRAAEERYRTLFENASEGIFLSTEDGRYLDINPSLVALLGYDSVEEISRLVTNIPQQIYVDAEDRTALVERLNRDGVVTGFETRLRRKDGSELWCVLSVRMASSAKAGERHLEGFVVDITKRKHAECELAALNKHLEQLVEERTEELNERARELEVANIKLQELDRLKSSFLSTVSHELRTPLTSILGFAKLINKDFGKFFLEHAHNASAETKGRRISENLAIIEREGERLTRLINDFLDLSRIESGKMEWREADVRPDVTIYQAVEAVRGQFDSLEQVALYVDVADTLPLLHVDPDRLLQVVVNLLNNAAKFTAAGSVRVSAGPTDAGMVRISVADTGIGVPLEDQYRIFDQFHQAMRQQDTLVDKPKGSGLGLAICKQIVDHYDGEIWVESEGGRGSVFHVELPVHAVRP
ncbi:MAG: ATP-binding protein [Desulfovibrionaceae bacterium]